MREPLEDLAEYRWEIVWCERLIIRSIAGVVEELCQDFPEDLGIDGSEDTEEASARQQGEQGEGASNLELPWRKEECTVSMLDLQGWFAGKVVCRNAPLVRWSS